MKFDEPAREVRAVDQDDERRSNARPSSNDADYTWKT
jgi:hypothetical protein